MNRIKHHVFLIKAHTGTGKTTATCRFINKMNLCNGYKILSITSRISLAKQHVVSFAKENIKMKSYLNPNIILDSCNNLIISIDSLQKINYLKWKNAIIYLDEVNSMLNYLQTTSTIKSYDKAKIFQQLRILINNASCVIGTDADMSDMVIRFFEKMNIEPYIYENTFVQKKATATEYHNRNKLIKDMKDKILKKKRDDTIVICFDSLKEQDILYQDIEKFIKKNKIKTKILRYSSTHGNEKDFAEINNKWTGISFSIHQRLYRAWILIIKMIVINLLSNHVWKKLF